MTTLTSCFIYKYHVRPKDLHLDYCWDFIYSDLKNSALLKTNQNNTATIVKVEPMIDYLKSKIEDDPYYLLDNKSKQWVIPKIEKLGRRFIIEDFE